jgi:hypothetical protein
VRSFAVLPLLAVFLVSLCGSQVPPPPSDVSGVVYFDANLNGIYDSCDSPTAGVAVAAYDDEGGRITAVTDNDGDFHLTDVPQGQNLITMNTNPGTVWPMSTRTEDGRAGQSVEIGQDDVLGVELGILRRLPVGETNSFLAALAFDDRNRNGEIDANECAIEGAKVVDRNGVVVAAPDSPAVLPGGPHGPPSPLHFLAGQSCAFTGRCLVWLPTDPEVGYCEAVVPRRIADNVYEVKLGFAPGRFTASLTGVAFIDRDDDGVRDDGEPGLSRFQVQALNTGADCPEPYAAVGAETSSDGTFVFRELAPGTYRFGYSADMFWDGTDFILDPTPEATSARVGNGEVHVDIPVRVEPAAYLEVMAFDDDDEDGSHDVSEEPIQGLSFCVTASGTKPGGLAYPGYSNCAGHGRWDGYSPAHLVGPLRGGSYDLYVEIDSNVGPVVYPSHPTPFVVSPGETGQLDLPLQKLTATEQLVHDDPSAILVEPHRCYTDRSFVRRPFEEGYNAADAIYNGPPPISETRAREIYEQLVHPTLSSERHVFFSIAGIDRKAPGIRECAYDVSAGIPGPHFWIVGYEVLSAMRVGWTYEVVLRDSQGLGQEAISLPITYDLGDFPSEPWWVVFVDESYIPLARCSSGSCETY